MWPYLLRSWALSSHLYKYRDPSRGGNAHCFHRNSATGSWGQSSQLGRLIKKNAKIANLWIISTDIIRFSIWHSKNRNTNVTTNSWQMSGIEQRFNEKIKVSNFLPFWQRSPMYPGRQMQVPFCRSHTPPLLQEGHNSAHPSPQRPSSHSEHEVRISYSPPKNSDIIYLMLFQTYMHFFLLQNIQRHFEDYWEPNNIGAHWLPLYWNKLI